MAGSSIRFFIGCHEYWDAESQRIAELRSVAVAFLGDAQINSDESVPPGVVRFHSAPFPHYAAEDRTIVRHFRADPRVSWVSG